MNYTISIEDGYIRQRSENGVAVQRAKATAIEAGRMDAHGSGLLPPVVRWVREDQRLWLFERPPAFCTLTYRDAMMHDEERKGQSRLYTIPVPWQVYLVNLTGQSPEMHHYVRNAPLSSLNDRVGVYLLPNLDDDGWACVHLEREYQQLVRQEPRPTPAELCMFWMNGMWMQGSNNNMPQALTARRQPQGFKDKFPDCVGYGNSYIGRGTASGHDVLSSLERCTIEDVLGWDYPQAPIRLDRVVKGRYESINRGRPVNLSEDTLVNYYGRVLTMARANKWAAEQHAHPGGTR